MRRNPLSYLRTALVLGLVTSTVISGVVQPLSAAPPFLERIFQIGARQGHPPKTVTDPSIEELARNIDWLEHEIDRWGTVVAKAPDVWGEARLTRYRSDVERVLEKDVDLFEPNQINGAQLISDQAFLAASFALKAEAPVAGGRGRVAVPTVTAMIANSTSNSSDSTVGANANAKISALEPFGLSADDKKMILESIKLEQTEVLDQKKRYLDHLSELRRLNEGDDVSDSPGYSLNLVRIPISVLPGKHSQEGYGAELTITATPELGPEILPTAFKDFVINDLVDQLSVPLVQFLNTDPKAARETIRKLEALENRPKVLAKLSKQFERGWIISDSQELASYILLTQIAFRVYSPATNSFPALAIYDEEMQVSIASDVSKLREIFAGLRELGKPENLAAVAQHSKRLEQQAAIAPSRLNAQTSVQPAVAFAAPTATAARLNAIYEIVQMQAAQSLDINPGIAPRSASAPLSPRNLTPVALAEILADDAIIPEGAIAEASQQIDGLYASLEQIKLDALAVTAVNIPTSSRRSTLPFPPAQLFDNYGMHDLAHVALDAYRAFEKEIVNRQIIHLTDVQGYLREEINSAYDMMSLPEVECFWTFEASGERTLVEALRHRRIDAIAELREGFRAALAPHLLHSSTLSLAWCVFVESLLLNERILEDMKNNGAGTVWLPLFGPNPPCEARDAFAAYVAQRWPVKVFAIDPVVNEQNVLDVSSISRQMQLAVALAFAGGEMSASAALQTLRQLQRDSATIGLNRTIVGFGHGESTFGWRFYPRFQTPPVESNVTVFFRDLVVGGPTDRQLLRSKQLEPGMRECVAIVLMPSFVPNVTFDTRGNWFKLNKPSHTALSMLETVQYSRSVVAMRENATACVQCPDRYRPGELERMLKRVQQLDAELPLQTLRIPVPIENSHGGFEIFSSGTRELAPELLGWYGAPGYDAAKGGTFFLAGDNFSIHDTKLIVGNKGIEHRLISRQILQVELPPGLQVLKDERLKEYHDSLALNNATNHYEGFVDAHIATPYGVSGHLLIPVIASDAEKGDCECDVELLSGDIRATLHLVPKTSTWTAPEALNVAQLPLVAFGAPRLPGLASRLAKISIQPIAEDNGRLTPVIINDVPSDRSVFNLTGAKAISTLKAGGDLQKSIAEYAIWRASRNDLTDFELDCLVSIDIEGISFAGGSVKMFVEVIHP